MAKLLEAKAYCNSEVAYLAWKADGKIDDCLGFMITRIHLDTGERRLLPTWVAFKTQSNANWEEQDTSVWPVQKFSWRDLTLRRSRDTTTTRPTDFRVKYEIVPVGKKAPGRVAVPASPLAQPGKYQGTPIPLYFCGPAVETNEITVGGAYGDIAATFTNGILSTQFLRKQMKTPDGQAPNKNEVKKRMADPADPLRAYLTGDVLPYLKTLFERAEAEDGTIYAALYELDDDELIGLLTDNAARLNLILSTAGSGKDADKKPIWDTTNHDVRIALRKLLKTRLQDRMFNNTGHIGHNKFAVLVVKDKPVAVWTGSTNWTSTGLCGQTNNTMILNTPKVAKIYFDYWQRLHADKLPVPKPIQAPNNTNQGAALRAANAKPYPASLDGDKTDLQAWYSPNTKTTGSAKTRTAPPDLQVVFEAMQNARQAIFFLAFNPGRTAADVETEDDVNTVVAAAVNIARFKPDMMVMGAISDPTALPGYTAPPKDANKDKKAPKIPLPAIFSPPGAPQVLMIRAAAISDMIGDLQKELLTAGTAIIHDKIVVIDPLSEADCMVVMGSHNLGFKASYANDENMLIIRGNRALAIAYAVHVMDVYDHYRFRAIEAQNTREAMLAGKTPKRETHKGFLLTDDSWQDPYNKDGQVGGNQNYFIR